MYVSRGFRSDKCDTRKGGRQQFHRGIVSRFCAPRDTFHVCDPVGKVVTDIANQILKPIRIQKQTQSFAVGKKPNLTDSYTSATLNENALRPIENSG